MTIPHDNPSLEAGIAVLLERTDTQGKDIAEIKQVLGSNFVTKDAFRPVQAIAFGLVSIFATALIGGFIALFFIKRP